MSVTSTCYTSSSIHSLRFKNQHLLVWSIVPLKLKIHPCIVTRTVFQACNTQRMLHQREVLRVGPNAQPALCTTEIAGNGIPAAILNR